ncbi:hypothetical protein MYAM1_002221 [Malassezia yamatoensis]|uniref:Uncharacterized protein n=1 Tax=Malassezia yamatoensis TaxID=253288 RepID=A0AAJ6CJ35_9BASI|nr:hypothetical protein MYAM1_002221 [Malassezia yamatoensis]
MPRLHSEVTDTESRTRSDSHAWEPYLSPPASGGSEPRFSQGDKRNWAHLSDECDEEQDNHEHTMKRTRPYSKRNNAVMTPPSTRGRRMGDRLGLGRLSRVLDRAGPGRHTRSGSDSLFSEWLPNETGAGSQDFDLYAEHAFFPSHETYPVHDAKHNPFLEGGPADVGFTGPNAQRAYMRASSTPQRQQGSTLYVFRGQRVVRPDRDPSLPAGVDQLDSPIEPRLLFPSRGTRVRYELPARNAVSDDEDNSRPTRTRHRGLFSKELEARTRQTERSTESSTPAFSTNLQSPSLEQRMSLPSNTRPDLSKYTQNADTLAKLERTNWGSDDEPDS